MLSGLNTFVHTEEIYWALKHLWDRMTLAFLIINMRTLVLPKLLRKLSGPRASAGPSKLVITILVIITYSILQSIHMCWAQDHQARSR